MRYSYKAKKGLETVSGTIEADSQELAIAKLEETGYLPIRVELVVSKNIIKKQGYARISSKDLNGFTRQLASLVKSRVQLIKALEIINRETQNIKLKEVIFGLIAEVKDGKGFSESLRKYPKYFSRIYVNMIASGEKSGLLENILLRLVDLADKEEEMRSKLRSALAYPILMSIMGAATVFVMITFVMPKLTKLFSDMGQDLPFSTRILIAMSNFMRDYWYWILLAIALVIFALKKFSAGEKNKEAIEKIKLRIPLFGRYIRIRAVARFCRTLSLLISNGIPIRDAIGATIPTVGNMILERDLALVSADLSNGLSMANSLSKVRLFPGFVVSLIGVGEEAGRLDEALMEVAVSYEKQLDEELKVMSSMIEPLIILTVGLIVGFIVISMLLPIFQINLR
jgi:type II secretory pathway component PulF